MINIKEAVIVEGKYDKMKLKSIINTTIIETNGFRIFKDKEKVNLIKKLAEKQGIVILTDSDSAGFVIRNHLKGIIPQNQMKHAYIPQIKGKEKRKENYSKEGTLGVEGVDEVLIINALKNAGVTINSDDECIKDGNITKTDLYRLGLTGRENSKELRLALLKKLNLPQYITTNALVDVLNSLTDIEQLERTMKEITTI
ncbi:MAG: DUF4093 domain-containing protein [Acutalibacteraceae bacterium]|nr:DUF4093 domain-containing protein [Acutalibacteraceae bacterium]